MGLDKFYSFINNNILFWGLLIGVMFYNYIESKWNFSYTDEILALILISFYLYRAIKEKRISREFSMFIIVLIVYILYSCFLGITSIAAIMTDVVIQMKPYIGFYCIYSLPIRVDDYFKSMMRGVCIMCAIFMLFIGLKGAETIEFYMGHVSRLATATTILGFLYFYCSARTKKNLLIMFLIFSIGVLSFRSKFYGFYTIAIFIFFFFEKKSKIKLSLKNIIVVMLGFLCVIWAAWEKIYLYLFVGTDSTDLFARSALYMYAPRVLNDYFPLGSGFATYSTWASGLYYSPLYYRYHLDNIYGISPNDISFVADTFFPVLAQFGYIGIILFCVFWKKTYNKAKLQLKSNGDVYSYKIILLIIIFFFIESIADSTITNNRGVFMMMLLALFLSENKKRIYLIK